jgi:hypothetical protein
MPQILAVFSLLASLGSVRTPSLPTPAAKNDVVRVVFSDGKVKARDTIPAGWTRLEMVTSTLNHAPALFRVPANITRKNLAAFATAVDTAAGTPAGALAMGGRIAGDNGQVIVNLKPGKYVLTCLTREDDGHRHGIRGESRIIVVTGASRTNTAPPRARVSMQMTDFAYSGPERWPAGSYLVRVENIGRQDHQFRVARLPAGLSFEKLVRSDDPRSLVKAVTGLGRMGPGVTYLPVQLPPGRYVLFCLVHDPRTHLTHNKLGMYKAISVQ